MNLVLFWSSSSALDHSDSHQLQRQIKVVETAQKSKAATLLKTPIHSTKLPYTPHDTSPTSLDSALIIVPPKSTSIESRVAMCGQPSSLHTGEHI